MVHEDFYNPGIPIEEPGQQERQAETMASFGKYYYDPAARAMQQQQQMIYPGGYGFAANIPQQGLGSPMRYDQYGNPMPTYNQFRSGYCPNPAINLNPGYQQQPQDQPLTMVIQGISQGGEYLPPIDIEDKITSMQLDYFQRYTEKEAEDVVNRKNTNLYGGFGFNYYGTPYYNPYQYNAINSEVMRDIEKIKEDARNSRLELNMKLSQLAHNYVHEDIDKDAIRTRYEGKVIELPQKIVHTYQANFGYDNLYTGMYEFNNAAYYQQQYAENNKIMREVIPEDADLKSCFANVGRVNSEWEMDEELHRRRDYTNTYNSTDGGYRYFVKKKAEERYAREHGIDLNHVSQRFNPLQAQQQSLNAFPTLKDSVSISPDGTLNVTCNIGSNAGKVYSVNEQEAGYQERKERFDRFLSSIPGSIYRNNG